jgi:hypothetical protein
LILLSKAFHADQRLKKTQQADLVQQTLPDKHAHTKAASQGLEDV